MYSCPHHNWISFEQPCPACFPKTYTSTGADIVISQKEDSLKDTLQDCLDTILKSEYESFEGAIRKYVVPKNAIVNAFNEYFSVKERDHPF